MKQQIRFRTFETNSSSTHNMIIIPDEQIELWDNNELYYIRWVYGDKIKKLVEENNGRLLYTKEELANAGLLEDLPKKEDYEDEDEFEDDLYEYLEGADFLTAEIWERDELETDETEYVTKSGEKLHILCQYGYDG